MTTTPHRRRSLRSIVLAGIAAIALAATAFAQDPPDEGPTPEAIQSRLDALAKDDPQSAELRPLLEQALADAKRAAAARQQAGDLNAEASRAPTRLAEVQAELRKAPDRALPAVAPDATTRDLEDALERAEAALLDAGRLEDKLGKDVTARTARQSALLEELTAAQRAIQETEDKLRATAGTDAVAETRRLRLRAELAAHRATVRKLEAERARNEAERTLLPLERDRATRERDNAARIAEFWRNRVAEVRKREAEAAARKAAEQQRLEITKAVEELRELAAKNQRLAEKRTGETGLAAQNARARSALAADRARLAEVRDRFRATHRRMAIGGLVGAVLQKELSRVRAIDRARTNVNALRTQFSRVQFEQLDNEESRDADVAASHQRLATTLRAKLDGPARVEAIAVGRDLLESQKRLTDAIHDDLNSLIATLGEHEFVSRELDTAIERYRGYLEERILWVRGEGTEWPSPVRVAGAVRWLADGDAWGQTGRRFLNGLHNRWPGIVAALLVLAGAIAIRRSLRRDHKAMADRIRSYRTDGFRWTVRALVGVAIQALPVPLAIWLTGRLLADASVDGDPGFAVGTAALATAPVLFTIGFAMRLAREQGVGEVHLRWPTASLRKLRQELRWFVFVGVPLGFASTVFAESDEWKASVGRTLFTLSAAAVAVLVWRLLRPSSLLYSPAFLASGSLLARTHRLWFSLMIAMPFALITLTLTGYHYTATELQARFRESTLLIAALMLVYSLLLRWLFIARRRLAIEQAKQRVQARVDAGTTMRETTTIDEESIDIPAVDAQTRQLFRSALTLALLVGLLLLWTNVLPALRGLDRLQLWPDVRVVTPTVELQAEPEASPATRPASPTASAASSPALPIPGYEATAKTESTAADAPTVITAADALFALVALLLTLLAAKNLPGLLEISMLRRLALDSGSRNAITTLCRYAILGIGVAITTGAIGLDWSKIQWLAAALTFGLAFGLQEIFANFVSGIIILIERPVRVGDIVTIGDVEGRVMRVRMRATTVLDWDRREMLIPNKTFITNNVINWSLSDPINRVIVPVGIAYGSDTKTAHELLLATAKKNAVVLADPGPSAVFRGFGASSLDFELRVFIASRDLWPEVVHGLHMEIDQAFRKAGIEIAFPQRDLHIRSASGLRGLVGGSRAADDAGDAE